MGKGPVSPRTENYPCRPARRGRCAEARHVFHDRTHDQSWQTACEDLVRWLDRGHPRPFAVGAVRAFGRGDCNGLRNLHAFAASRREAAADGLIAADRPQPTIWLQTWPVRYSPGCWFPRPNDPVLPAQLLV